MAALDIPFAHNIASPMASRDDASIASSANNTHDPDSLISGPATYAAFSPVTLSANTPSRSAHRSTVLVHQKSPLLLATPPQITRALAYSHPFLLPLNTFVGLLTWSTGDPWQSFLLLCSFWLVILYGDTIILRAGPVAVGAGLIIGMYGRRYSPLSSSSWNGSAKNSKKKGNASQPPPVASSSSNASNTDSSLSDSKPGHKRNASEVTKTKHQKTLDEIVETLKEFTGRCNALMDPLLVMTDFLSTQTTATSATTKPALTAMFVRLIIVTPFWFALTFSPLQIITARRVVLVFGTIILTWHARVMRVTRTLLWRSSVIRRTASAVTGLRFDTPIKNHAALQMNGANLGKSGHKKSASRSAGVKFTFIIYENQRRWLGLGWTHSLFAYERAAWTDEHNNPVPPKDEFELPHVEDGSKMKWEWVESSRWRVDGVPDEQGAVDYDGDEARNGWIYYDNKWQYGRRGTDGWGRWTRRRKWYRDAELVEADEDTASIKSVPEAPLPKIVENGAPIGDDTASIRTLDDNASVHSTSTPSRFWPGLRRRTTNQSTVPSEKEKEREKRSSLNSSLGDDVSGLGIEVEMELQKQGKDGGQWGIGDEARMNLE